MYYMNDFATSIRCKDISKEIKIIILLKPKKIRNMKVTIVNYPVKLKINKSDMSKFQRSCGVVNFFLFVVFFYHNCVIKARILIDNVKSWSLLDQQKKSSNNKGTNGEETNIIDSSPVGCMGG